MDVSIYNFPIELYYMLPKWEVTIKATAFVPVILFGVFGNIILLTIISRNRNLRTPTNLFIANMAVADLATVLFCPIVFMFHDFYQNYQLGAFGCKSEGFLQGGCKFIISLQKIKLSLNMFFFIYSFSSSHRSS